LFLIWFLRFGGLVVIQPDRYVDGWTTIAVQMREDGYATAVVGGGGRAAASAEGRVAVGVVLIVCRNKRESETEEKSTSASRKYHNEGRYCQLLESQVPRKSRVGTSCPLSFRVGAKENRCNERRECDEMSNACQRRGASSRSSHQI